TRTPHLIQCGEAAKIQVTEGEVNWTYVCFTRGETSPAGSWLQLESAATRGEAQLGSAVRVHRRSYAKASLSVGFWFSAGYGTGQREGGYYPGGSATTGTSRRCWCRAAPRLCVGRRVSRLSRRPIRVGS